MKKIRKFLLPAALVALVALAASSANVYALDVVNLSGKEAALALEQLQGELKKSPNDFESLKSAGILLHQMSRATPNKEQVELGDKYLKQASQIKPTDAETKAWQGSITTMKALFETDPGKQTFFVKLGTRAMDAAIQQDPENQVVRLIRGNNSLALPPFLKRTQFAVEDFQKYLSLCSKQKCPPPVVEDAKQKIAQAQKIVAESK
jgi:hypothetical protein